MTEPSNPTPQRRVSYGPEPSQFFVVTTPSGSIDQIPVVGLIHGGFWRARHRLDLMNPLQGDLLARGFATCNIEYRRTGEPGGGYPGTLSDIAAALDHLAQTAGAYGVDPERLALVGHSAGGHLALWAASDHLVDSDPVASPRLRPRLVVGLAAVVDLYSAFVGGLGEGAVASLLGGSPADRPDGYRCAQPTLNPDVTLLVHGDADGRVPVEQSLHCRDRAQVMVFEGEDHFDVIDPASNSWQAVIGALDRFLAA